MREPLFLILIISIIALFAVGFIEDSVMDAVERIEFTQ